MTEEHPLYALARRLHTDWTCLSEDVMERMFPILYRVVDDRPGSFHESYTGTFEYLVCSGFFSAEKMDALYAELVLAGAHRDPETGELWEQET